MPASTPLLRLNLIGAGRVGLSLARLWQAQGGLRVQAVCNPGFAGQERARRWLMPPTDDQPAAASAQRAVPAQPLLVADVADLPPADIWLLAVPDGQIAPVAQAIADLALAAQHPAQAWHASGFLTAEVLAPLRRHGWTLASTHPALSFADVASACQQFAGTVCALEGDEAAVATATGAFSAIGGQCFWLASTDKPLYHGAAVFASNFLPVLQAVASQLWQGSGVPAALCPQLAQGFLRRVSANVLALGPAAALTGPAARGDWAVVSAQADAMHRLDPVLGAAYLALSELAGRLARQGVTINAAMPFSAAAPSSPADHSPIQVPSANSAGSS